MQAFTNTLANSFIQHPARWALIWRILGATFLLLLAAFCLYLAFGIRDTLHRHYFPKGSAAAICWKTGWLLQVLNLFGLGDRTQPPPLVLVGVCVSTVLILSGAILGGRYYMRFGKALQREENERLGRPVLSPEEGWPPPPNNQTA